MPKQRRSVLPVEQPRRKKTEHATNRRMNAIKHPPAVFKDAFGSAKIGNLLFSGNNFITFNSEYSYQTITNAYRITPVKYR